MATEDYLTFCNESLWQPWRAGEELPVPPPFDRDAMPEPYILFKDGDKPLNNPLVVLTTNPGATMCHQRRAAVKFGYGPLSKCDEYNDEGARKLGDFYKECLKGKARERIDKIQTLRRELRCDGVMQVEACPFHSPSWPKNQKIAFTQEIGRNPLPVSYRVLASYVRLLRTYLKDRRVVVLQASNKPAERPSCRWLKWVAETAGFDGDHAECRRLNEEGSKTTAAVWISNPPCKALVLTTGGAWLPAERLAPVLQEFWST
jgi:hypothetical protein